MLIALVLAAFAEPVDLAQQVRLLDTDGSPIHGTVRITVSLQDDGIPGAPDAACFTQVFPDAVVDNGFASLMLEDVPDACFDTPRWVAVGVGDPAVELQTRMPIVAVPIAVHAQSADTVGGATFGEQGDMSADIKAYIDGRFCERNGGSWQSGSNTCDGNMVTGSGSWNSASCPSGYRVCTVPEAMMRAPNSTITGWHWATHESSYGSGNLDVNGSRWSFPYCPGSGNAPLVHMVNNSDGGTEVDNVICYDSGYTPLCCR